MRKKLILLLATIMLCTLMATMSSNASSGGIATYATTYMNPFAPDPEDPYLTHIEDWLTSMWVGDWLKVCSDYTYEVLKGAECVKLEDGKLKFTNVGTAVVRATRKSDNVTKDYEFVISPAKKAYFERIVPERIKIGSWVDASSLYVYRNYLLEGYSFSYCGQNAKYGISETNFDEYFLRSINYGAGFEPELTREHRSSGCIYREGSDDPWVFLLGHAVRPGVFTFTINEENGKNVQKVVIEEPVIHTNIPDRNKYRIAGNGEIR